MNTTELNKLSGVIVDCALKVHTKLGPGLLERVHLLAMLRELSKRGIQARSEVSVPVVYDGEDLGEGFRAGIILELKSVKHLEDVHPKQLLTFLRLADKRLGLLFNFNEILLKHGIVRVVNGLQE
ncbi:MAG: GxxExxY protein [Planctomycetes bacterium]|nr:GxxExxY protein [Planctomycetota bacterium]